MENKSLKKARAKLFEECKSSIEIIIRLYNAARNEDILSKAREEYAKLIAVKLRVLLITSGSDSLFKQLGIEGKFLFEPVCCKSSNLPGNLVQSYELITINFKALHD